MYSLCLGGTSETSLDTKHAQYPAGYTPMYSYCLGGTNETKLDTKPQHRDMHCHIERSTSGSLDSGSDVSFSVQVKQYFCHLQVKM